ncbi:MAG TPA: 5'-methylthioadenosine/S-adenosylhomocysteine nucleosidase [Candidatus Didemnitutus sp.]|nr:5'-methylthioadenosine/S-adenosylhomocysteine nucleosidase [Candidatus Didemnitutus sp.]
MPSDNPISRIFACFAGGQIPSRSKAAPTGFILIALIFIGLPLRADDEPAIWEKTKTNIVTAKEPAGAVDVLVQGAEQLEVDELVAALHAPQKHTVGPFNFWVGTIGPHRVAVSLTGESLINCTAATLAGIETFAPKLIVNQGTSGAQVRYLGLHDIIIGQRALDYGNFVSAPRGPGQGSAPLTWTPVVQRLRDPRTDAWVEYPNGFAGDPIALAVALRTRNPMGRVFGGVIGSAHEVNLELDRVGWSHRTFGMDVEEMESGHVAAIAHVFGIRYIAFRVVSDAPYEHVPFFPLAARATGLFTINFLENLPPLR